MLISLYDGCVISLSPEMSCNSIPSVYALGYLVVDKPHDYIDVCARGSEFEVVMVIHHLEVFDADIVALCGISEHTDDNLVGPFFTGKDPTVGPGGDVVGIFVLAYSVWSWHAQIGSKMDARKKRMINQGYRY